MINIRGAEVRSTQDFYQQFFAQREDLFPDYGGRNLDALHDDLRELSEPLLIVWEDSESSKALLFGLFDKIIETLRSQGPDAQSVTVELR